VSQSGGPSVSQDVRKCVGFKGKGGGQVTRTNGRKTGRGNTKMYQGINLNQLYPIGLGNCHC